VAAGAGVALAPRPAIGEQQEVSVHPLLAPVTRTVYTVIRTGTARRPDVHLLNALLKQAAAAATT
jgi:DNA-binding transcriptional LysR family regulator